MKPFRHPFQWFLPPRAFASGPGDNETIEVKRRRQGTGAGPTPGRRAETPVRRRDGGQGSSGGGGGSTGGGGSGLPRGKQMPIWLVILLIIGYVIVRLISPGEDSATLPQATQPVDFFAQDQPTEGAALPTRTPAPRNTRAPNAAGEKWTVMLYQDADDQILEQDIFLDLNEVERVGSRDQVNIVAQLDRYKGAYSGDGNWTGARRYFVTQDNDLTRIKSQVVDDLGEVNMASGDTLVNFIRWAVENYPADRYALILSDHGAGWPGGWSDPDPGGRERSSIPIVSALDDNLFLNELDASLEKARQVTGIDKFELIGMDACLMGHIEVFSALAPHAHFAVASQETEPALGWAYSGFLEALTQNPDMDGAALGEQIVSTYIKDDQRIVDSAARADFLKQGSPMGGLFGSSSVSASQLAQQIGRGVTLTAVDLAHLPPLMDALNNLVIGLQDEDQSVVASGRSYAQSFTNIFGKSGPAPYIDLGSFVQILKREATSQKAAQAEDEVLAALRPFVVAERHGSGKPGATGVSIYFPNSTLYSSPVAGPQSYTGVANRFAKDSLWDDFLAYHYNDQPIVPSQRAAVVPEGSPSRAPGAGTISLSPVSASAKTAAPGQPVRFSLDISGSNIGYVYLFVGYYDSVSNSILVADTDYLESPNPRQAGGVYYPQWSANNSFTLSFEWDPTVFEISDGSQSSVALFNPTQYGASAAQAVYTVDGTFTYAADGQSRRAQILFQDGKAQHVYGFTSPDPGGSPAEIIPQSGDTFTISEKWLDLDSAGKVDQTAYQDGATLTFGSDMFTLNEVYAAQGDYIVGFIVTDLDGNAQEAYTRVAVQ